MYLFGMRGTLGLKLIFSAQLMIIISFQVLWNTYGIWVLLSVSALLICFGLWIARFHRKHETEIGYVASSSKLNAFPKPRKLAYALMAFEGIAMVIFGFCSYLVIVFHQVEPNKDLSWFQAFPFFWLAQTALFGFINSTYQIFKQQRTHHEP